MVLTTAPPFVYLVNFITASINSYRCSKLQQMIDIHTYVCTKIPDRKNRINLIPSRYHWDQLDAKVIVLDINFPVRLSNTATTALVVVYNG
jgi:hypothetical protein